MNFHYYIIFLVLFSFFLAQTRADDGKVSLLIRNLAGVPIDAYWRSPDGKLVAQSSSFIRNGTKYAISSFETHQFLFTVHKAELDENSVSTSELITMSRHDMKSELFMINGELVSKTSTALTRRRDSLASDIGECKRTQNRSDDKKFTACVAGKVRHQLSELSETKETLRHYRDTMGERIGQYLCDDEEEATRVDELVEGNVGRRVTLPGAAGSKRVKVTQILASEGANIYVVDNFVSEGECEQLIDVAAPNLVEATEYNTKKSGSRRADAFSVFFNEVDFTDSKDVLSNKNGAAVYQRVHALVNEVTGLGLNIDGQEGMSIIRYKPGDEYQPHCDGSCNLDTSESDGHVRTGARVATAIMYCQAPDSGGATTFSHAGTVVRAKAGRVLVFSYPGNAFEYSGLYQGVNDPNGLTKHAGCPVEEGQKWIATAWWRAGVDAHDTWHQYDSRGDPLK